MGVVLDYIQTKREVVFHNSFDDRKYRNSIKHHTLALIKSVIKKNDTAMLEMVAGALLNDLRLVLGARVSERFRDRYNENYFDQGINEIYCALIGIDLKMHLNIKGDLKGYKGLKESDIAALIKVMPELSDPIFVYGVVCSRSTFVVEHDHQISDNIIAALKCHPKFDALKLLYARQDHISVDENRHYKNNPLFICGALAKGLYGSDMPDYAFIESRRNPVHYKAVTGVIYHLLERKMLSKDDLSDELAKNNPLEHYHAKDLPSSLKQISSITSLKLLVDTYLSMEMPYPNYNDPRSLEANPKPPTKIDAFTTLKSALSQLEIKRTCLVQLERLCKVIVDSPNKLSDDKKLSILAAIRQIMAEQDGFGVISRGLSLDNTLKIAVDAARLMDNENKEKVFATIRNRMPTSAKYTLIKSRMLDNEEIDLLMYSTDDGRKKLFSSTQSFRELAMLDLDDLAKICVILKDYYPDFREHEMLKESIQFSVRVIKSFDFAAEHFAKRITLFEQELLTELVDKTMSANKLALNDEVDMSFIAPKAL